MNSVIVPDIKSKILWWILEGLAKLGFGWIKKKINDWEQKSLQSNLTLMPNPKVIVDGLQDMNPHLSITVVLWSSLPARLHPRRIIGKINAKEFEREIRWDKEGEPIFNHAISTIEPNKNSWTFYIPTSVEELKKNTSSFWYVNFKVIFQHDLPKLFQNIKIKMRDGDAKRISEI